MRLTGVAAKLSDEIAQRKCLQMVSDMMSLFVLGSPNSAVFSLVQKQCKGSAKYQETSDEGTAHLRFVMRIFDRKSMFLACTPVELAIRLRQGRAQHEQPSCEIRSPVLFWLGCARCPWKFVDFNDTCAVELSCTD